ncbi:DUF4937 domain-containing protein [Halobacillus shinanisalinarum]|uniref:DUF4937 domain-containing protein n=1 Tax=Halobacillus shinanisalinarum TaxID=2932258 RepID=UPI0037C07428
MIIKRILCKVKEGQQAAFSQHQQEWQPIRKVEGFLGQLGGWLGCQRTINSLCLLILGK